MSVHRESGWRCVWVKGVELWEYLLASWGDPWTRCPSGSQEGFLIDSMALLVESPFLYNQIPVCHSFSPFPPSQSCKSQLSTLNRVREKWASLAEFCTTGEAKHSLTYSFLHSREGKVSLGTEPLCHLGGEELWVMSNYTSTLSNASKLVFFFCSSSVLELLWWIPELSQGLSHLWVIV